MSTQAILDQMILVVLNITLWQGRKALQAGDLALNGIDVARLPPGTLATLGSKRIISPDAVKIFMSLKRAAMKLCLQQGVRFGGDGYAIPRGKVAALNLELKRLQEQFMEAKEEFLMIYEDEVEKWIDANPPEWGPIIRAAVDAPKHIRKVLKFSWSAFDVKVPTDIAVNGLESEVNSLYGQLCHEIQVVARQTFENSMVGKLEITQRTLRPIKTIRSKLAGMLFLDPAIAETIQVIDETLDKLPEDGVIKGTDLNMVAGLVGRQLANMGRVIPVQGAEREELLPEDETEAPVTNIPVEVITVPQNTGNVAPITWDF